MDRHQFDHLLGTFCHLDSARSYSFDSVLSLICHRCTSIYSTFLIITLLALALSWKGQILNWKTKSSVAISAISLLTICGLQVLIQDLSPLWGGGSSARVITGALVALGLFQLSQLTKDDFPLPKGTWIQLIALSSALVIHLFLLGESFIYNSVTTLAGLAWLYYQINLHVLEPLISGRPPLIRHGAILICIFLEWAALYAINVAKIHV